MPIDFKKILDFLQPSYEQLKTLLIITLGAICAVYFIGVKSANFQHAVEENTKSIVDLQTQITNNHKETTSQISSMYVDILDMNTRNNEFWDTKFNILIKYGDKNKNLLMDMIQMQDEQQKLYEQNYLKNKKYISKPDSSSIKVTKIDKK